MQLPFNQVDVKIARETMGNTQKMIYADYHTHTPLCFHAEGEPEEFVSAAISKGLKEYGISDHAPVTPEPFDDWRMRNSDLPEYFRWIERARDAADGSVIIRAGLECDWLPSCEGWIETLRTSFPWDYFIGSVHYIAEQWDFDNPKWLGKWAETDVDHVWTLYWKAYHEMVKSGLFEICAHPDLIKKFGYVPEGDLRRFYEPVVESIRDAGSVIELNTAGWHKPCAEQYPASEFLTLCADAEISLVISSDAHHPSEVGRDFEKAAHLASECGFRGTTTVHQGEREFLPFV